MGEDLAIRLYQHVAGSEKDLYVVEFIGLCMSGVSECSCAVKAARLTTFGVMRYEASPDSGNPIVKSTPPVLLFLALDATRKSPRC